jgi:hypothetical protein
MKRGESAKIEGREEWGEEERPFLSKYFSMTVETKVSSAELTVLREEGSEGSELKGVQEVRRSEESKVTEVKKVKRRK